MASLALGYIMPLLAFFFVFLLTYALLDKTRILGDHKAINWTLSVILAIFFVFTPLATKFTALTVPWVIIFIIIVFLMLLVISFVRGKIDDIVDSKVISLIIVAVILIIFIVSALNVFGPIVSQGAFSPEAQTAVDYVSQPQFIAMVIILIVAGILSWQVTKK
jgi:hypothetical protein